MQGKVIRTIDVKDGTVSYEVQGVDGTKCTDITDLLTAGTDVEEEHFTEEYCIEVEEVNEILE